MGVTASGESVDTAFTLVVDDLDYYPLTVGEDLSLATEDGSYVLELAGVADNCTVGSSNPQTVDVLTGLETYAAFEVSCTKNGTAKITVSTTGENLDDLYTLSFDAGARNVYVGPNQFLVVSLPVKTYSLSLTGVADNCSVSGENPVGLDIQAETQATASFAVACVPK